MRRAQHPEYQSGAQPRLIIGHREISLSLVLTHMHILLLPSRLLRCASTPYDVTITLFILLLFF